MRRADTTFVNLRATLDDLEPLVDESKPVAKKLRPFLAELRPLARDARPTLRDLSALVRSPGASNDLIELTKSSVPLRNAAVGPTKRNGKERDGAFPGSTEALKDAAPGARHRAPVRPRPHRLVRRLQPLRALRRARRRQPRRALRQPLRARQRRAQAAARAGRCRAQALKDATSLDQRWRCPGSIERGATLQADRRLPVRRVRRAAGAVKRAMLTLVAVAGIGVAWIAMTGAGSNPDKGKYWVQFDNAFGLIQGGDLKVAGVRAGTITDIKLDKRTKHALDRLQDRQERLRLAAQRHLLRVAPAVADRRVLRRLPARHRQAGAQAGRRHPGQPHRLDGRARPRHRHPAPPLPRAPEPHHRLAGRRRRGQRRATSTPPSAAPAPRCARPTRCSPRSARRTGSWPT